MLKWEARNGKKEVFALDVLQFKRLSMSRNLMENGAPKTSKMVPKSDQDGTKNHPGAGFLRFGGNVFSAFWGTGKSRPKIRKNQPAELKTKIRAIFRAARRNVRGCRGGKEGFRTPPGSARILARNLKPRILGFAKTWQELELWIRHAVPQRGRRKVRAHIPPGLRKGLPMGGVVLSFPLSSFDNFYQDRTKMGSKSTTDGTNLAQGGARGTRKSTKIWNSLIK